MRIKQTAVKSSSLSYLSMPTGTSDLTRIVLLLEGGPVGAILSGVSFIVLVLTSSDVE